MYAPYLSNNDGGLSNLWVLSFQTYSLFKSFSKVIFSSAIFSIKSMARANLHEKLNFASFSLKKIILYYTFYPL